MQLINTINKSEFRLCCPRNPNLKFLSGEIELDESYFGGKHKGNVRRSTKSKIPVFGILKCDGKVYTQIVTYVKC